MQGKKTIPQFSIDSQVLYDTLICLRPGDTISYEKLTGFIAKDVQGPGRGNLMSARRKALSTHGLVFEAIHNEGLKCLTDSEKANLGEPAMRSITRKARRSAKKILSVENFSALSKDDQINHNLSLTWLGAISQMGNKKSIDKLKASVRATESKLPFIRCLESFK